MTMTEQTPVGLIALIGSGETTRYGGQVFERLVRSHPQGTKLAVLETPAGFELNSAAVAERVSSFLRLRLNNFNTEVLTIPARQRGGGFSPDDPAILAPAVDAAVFFMGPGSPSYAIRQLRGSLAWELIRARWRQGASLVFASAAAIATGRHALPVYEIYKVGEDPHWLDGLDLFTEIGLELVIVPHWNNREGGVELDTGFCFMGQSRFVSMRQLLPDTVTVVGIDELTSLVLDSDAAEGRVMGLGQVHILRGAGEKHFDPKTTFSLAELGDFHKPTEIRAGSGELTALLAAKPPPDEELKLPAEIAQLAEERHAAREQGDWNRADLVRKKIESLGFLISDTTEGSCLRKKE
jgi:cyanophycinase-like exopeptidase